MKRSIAHPSLNRSAVLGRASLLDNTTAYFDLKGDGGNAGDPAGDPGTDPQTDPQGGSGQQSPQSPAPQQGEPDKDWKAEFEAQREIARKQETRAKANADAARELAALKASTATDQDKLIAAAKDEAEKSTRTFFQGQLLDLSIEAAAGTSFQNPEDAVTNLRGRMDEFLNDDGTIDKPAVKKAVADLLKTKPYLGVSKKPPSFDGGQRNGTTGTTDMNRRIRGTLGIG